MWLQKQCKYKDKLLFCQFSPSVTAEAASAAAISKPDPHENKDKRALGNGVGAESEWQSAVLGSWWILSSLFIIILLELRHRTQRFNEEFYHVRDADKWEIRRHQGVR